MGSMCASPRYVTIPHPPPNPSNLLKSNLYGSMMQVQGMLSCPPPHPTHPTTQPIQPVLGGCMQVQGMLPSPHPAHPTYPNHIRTVVCVQVQGTLSSPPPPPTHPTHPTYPNQIRTVVCVQVQGTLSSPPPPTHPPTHPTYPNRIGMVVCMQVQGMSSSPPPPTHPPNPSNLSKSNPYGSMYASPRYVIIPPTTQRGASERKTEAQVIHARRKWERGTSEKKCEAQVRVLPVGKTLPKIALYSSVPQKSSEPPVIYRTVIEPYDKMVYSPYQLVQDSFHQQ